MLNNILLQVAKIAILSKFDDKYTLEKKSLLTEYPFLSKNGAAFVTLKYDGNLRGCIGSIIAHTSLYEDILHNANSAAFSDPRFKPLAREELQHLTLEISVLSEPQILEYEDYDDLLKKVEPNLDGLILKHPGYQGTFLPQVWEELPTAKEFLEHLSMKSGANLSIYEEHPNIYRYRVEHIKEQFDDIKDLSQGDAMIRSMSVSGSFYPSSKLELERYFEHFTKEYSKNFELPDVKTKTVIVPHAGYVYSGYTANIAYRILGQSDIKKFVVIGPSHKVTFNGISLCDFTSYETPFGELDAEHDLVKKLKDKFSFTCLKDAHSEHSTEVQFPFIKHYIPDAKIVELVYGRIDADDVSKVIDFVLAQEDCGVIISTDLSHFHDLKDANNLDSIFLESVDKLDEIKLRSGCEACGIVGVEAMILSAKKLSLNSHILDYRTSADASGDKSSVVGYMSAYFS